MRYFRHVIHLLHRVREVLMWWLLEDPAFMQKMHTKSPYGSYHIPVILGVVSTNCHTHYFSVVVSGGTTYHAKTVHHVLVWFLPYFCHVRSGFH